MSDYSNEELDRETEKYTDFINNVIDKIGDDENYSSKNPWLNKVRNASEDELKRRARDLYANGHENSKERTIESYIRVAGLTDKEGKEFIHLTESFGINL